MFQLSTKHTDIYEKIYAIILLKKVLLAKDIFEPFYNYVFYDFYVFLLFRAIQSKTTVGMYIQLRILYLSYWYLYYKLNQNLPINQWQHIYKDGILYWIFLSGYAYGD